MKNIPALIFITLLAVACHKKKSDPAPTPPSTPVFVVHQISAKVDGTEKYCDACYSGSNSGGLRGIYFGISGMDEQIYFGCDSLPHLGVHTLVKYGNPNLMYIKTNTYYHASVGSFTITAIDTSAHGVVNRLTAAFS